MQRYVCFLRAINIGRKNRVSMDVLRAFFSDMGIDTCKSYIQSGNFILHGDAAIMNEETLAERMRNDLAVETVVFLRTYSQYQTLIDSCPYGGLAKEHPKQLLVSFFQNSIDGEKIALLQEEMAGTARLHLSENENELYTYLIPEEQYNNFSNNALEKILHTKATTRNWNTILKMRQLQKEERK